MIDLKSKSIPPTPENDVTGKMKMETHKILLPLKIQAYERTTLFLERINPESLIMRNHRAGMTSLEIQRELLRNIREEFEHNLAQQIYLTNATWEIVCSAKEEMTKLIKLAGTQVEGTASALAYTETFLIMAGKLQQLPTKIAIEKVRSEIKLLL